MNTEHYVSLRYLEDIYHSRLHYVGTHSLNTTLCCLSHLWHHSALKQPGVNKREDELHISVASPIEKLNTVCLKISSQLGLIQTAQYSKSVKEFLTSRNKMHGR